MRARWLAALLLVTAGLAGCIGSEDGSTVDPASTDASLRPPQALSSAIAQSHDHSDAALHNFSWNLERVGYHSGYEKTPSAEDPAGFSGGFRGFAVSDGYAYLCRGGEASGVVIVNVSDPSNPSFVSRFAMPQCNDVVVSEDGRWVVAGTQRNSIMDVAQPSEAAPVSAPRGAYLIDVQDKTDPSFESFFPVPYNGVHTLTSYATADGRQLFMVQSYDLYATADPTGQLPLPSPGGAAPVTHRTVITELVERPDGTHELERIGQYSATGATPQNPDKQIIVHDAIVAHHPVEDTRYLIVAYWDLGVHILNFEDPSNPQLVATYENFEPSAFANIHRADAFDTMIDGKWVMVTQPEIATADETGQLTFVDITDPSNPEKLGHWTLPGELKITEPYIFSPHNFRLTDDGYVYIGHFHGGVWAISVDGPGSPTDPVTVGGIEPTAPNGTLPGGPMTWGVEVHDGHVYAMDTPTGLHVLDYTGP